MPIIVSCIANSKGIDINNTSTYSYMGSHLPKIKKYILYMPLP